MCSILECIVNSRQFCMLHLSIPPNEVDVVCDCSGEFVANFDYLIVALIVDALSLTADTGVDIIVVSQLAQ